MTTLLLYFVISLRKLILQHRALVMVCIFNHTFCFRLLDRVRSCSIAMSNYYYLKRWCGTNFLNYFQCEVFGFSSVHYYRFVLDNFLKQDLATEMSIRLSLLSFTCDLWLCTVGNYYVKICHLQLAVHFLKSIKCDISPLKL